MLQLFLVLEEESQVVVRDIDLEVGPELFLLLLGLPSARESMRVYLSLDLFGSVCHEYS